MIMTDDEFPASKAQLPASLDGDGRLMVATAPPKILAETTGPGHYACTNAYLSAIGGPKAVTRCGRLTVRVREVLGNYDANYKILYGPSAAKCVDELLGEQIQTKSPAVASKQVYPDGTMYIDVVAKNKTPDQASAVEVQITMG
jgi:hypothetical protein